MEKLFFFYAIMKLGDRMKKALLALILFFIFFLFYQMVFVYLAKSHNINYVLNNKEEVFKVKERFNKNYYYLEIEYKDRFFSFDIDNLFNKQKKIIQEVLYYENDQVLCLRPIYLNNVKESSIYCNKNKKQMSYEILKNELNLEDLRTHLLFDNKLYLSDERDPIISRDLKYFVRNAKKDEFIGVYRYKEIEILNEVERNTFTFSEKDIYQNKLGAFVDKYFLIPIFNDNATIKGFNVIDLSTSIRSYFLFHEAISQNSYIQGVVNNKVYLVDKSNKRQYEIDASKDKYTIVGSTADSAELFDGNKWSKADIQNFINTEVYFKKEKSADLSNYDYIEDFEDDRSYYFYNSNKEFYRVYKDALDKSIFLFKNENFKVPYVAKGSIYIIDDITLYRYDEFGLKPLIRHNEFRYNYTKIVGAYNK